MKNKIIIYITKQMSGSVTYSSTITPQTFYLDDFNTSISGEPLDLCGGAVTQAPTVNAEAVLFMKLSIARTLFKIQVDSADADDIDLTDVQYAVDVSNALGNDPSSGFINPVNAMMHEISGNGAPLPIDISHAETSGRIRNSLGGTGKIVDPSRNLVRHDFARFVCRECYGSDNVLDIIDFETNWQLAMDMAGIKKYEDLYNKLAHLQRHSPMTDASNGTDNIPRVIWKQIQEKNPGRIEMSGNDIGLSYTDASWSVSTGGQSNGNGAGIRLANTQGFQPLPLIEGDVLAFKLTLGTSANQDFIQNRIGFDKDNIYLIKIVLVEDGSYGTLPLVNTEPVDPSNIGGESQLTFIQQQTGDTNTWTNRLNTTLKNEISHLPDFNTQPVSTNVNDFHDQFSLYDSGGSTGNSASPSIAASYGGGDRTS